MQEATDAAIAAARKAIEDAGGRVMADTGAPRYPVIHVIHLDSDVHPNEPGLASVHDELTGVTTVQDSEKYYYGPPKQ